MQLYVLGTLNQRKKHIHNIYNNTFLTIKRQMKKLFVSIILFFTYSVLHANDLRFWKSIYQPFDSLMHEAEHEMTSSSRNDSQDFSTIIRAMHEIADSKNDKNMKVRALYWEADMTGMSDIKKTTRLTAKALAMVDSAYFKYDYYRLLAMQSNLLLNEGKYYDAFILCNRISPYFSSIGDWEQKALCDGNIGLIYLFVEDYNEALHYLSEARQWFKKEKKINPYLLASQQIAYIYENTGRKDEAMEILHNIITDFPKEGSKEIQYYYLTSYYRLLTDSAQKEKYLNLAIKIAKETNNWQCIMSAMKNKAFRLYETGETDSAKHYAMTVYNSMNDNTLKFGQKGDIYELLAQIYNRQEDYKSAFHFKQLAGEYQDSVKGFQVKSNIQKEKTRQNITSYTYQLRELKLEKEQQNRITWIIGIALVILTILSSIIIYLLRKRTVDEKRLRELEKKELTTKIDTEINKVETKNRELSSNMLLLMTKNNTLKELYELVDTEAKSGNIVKKTTTQIKNKISDILKEEDDWEQFKMHFEEVHPSFFKRLVEAHPDLTDNELRLCAYCKMNIGNKQIAQMLSVQPQTVIIARYRMRKKMNLPKETSLDDYLRNI